MNLIDAFAQPRMLFACASFAALNLLLAKGEQHVLAALPARGLPTWVAEHIYLPLARVFSLLLFIALAYPALFGLREAPSLIELLNGGEQRVSHLINLGFLLSLLLPLLPLLGRLPSLVLPIQSLLAAAMLFHWLAVARGVEVNLWPGGITATAIVVWLVLAQRLAAWIAESLIDHSQLHGADQNRFISRPHSYSFRCPPFCCIPSAWANSYTDGARSYDSPFDSVWISRMQDEQLLRYSRQILLPEFGVEAQDRLLAARVLIIGAGGLGSPVAMYLAAAGVGTLVIADPDVVDLSNLQRQLLHGQADIGRAKVDSARDRLAALNPETQVIALQERLEAAALRAQIDTVDLVIDASDNFATRYAVNAACVAARKPLVSGAAIRLEGQVAVFRPDLPDSPCYRCLYRDGTEVEQTCAENGVLAPIVGIVGSIQAMEAIKVLTGIGETLCGRLLIIDAKRMDIRTLKLKRDPTCPVCATTSS